MLLIRTSMLAGILKMELMKKYIRQEKRISFCSLQNYEKPVLAHVLYGINFINIILLCLPYH